ncbi:30S ribosomal protein S8e [Candidatus Woesearchaeota archaeon]|nr:30S ribosomal protein S8e [Candidatus Woesearchaeota archaeon]HIH25827.1 30S ribosomal protein S8e [Nanoarchaeota archaeon]
MLSQKRPKRKVTGGRFTAFSKKKKANAGSIPSFTKVGPTKLKERRARSGVINSFLLTVNVVNVMNPKTKKSQKAELKTVVESPANRNFVRRNIITKGSVVETSLGKVKITSRPGQEGTLNGVLV